MADEKYTFEQARIRLEEIAAEVRKKDTSLEKSLDLLEEGVRLANICTELVDHTDVSASVVVPVPDADAGAEEGAESPSGQAPSLAEPEADGPAGEDGGTDVEGAAETGDEPGGSDEDGADGFDEADDEVEDPADDAVGD